MDGVLKMIELKKRSDIHWARKIWHMAGVSFIAVLYAFIPERISLILLLTAFLIFVPMDIFRQRYEWFNQFMVAFFRPILRQSEVHRLAGTSYLLTGVLIVAFLFPRPIVQMTLLFLAFADPLASYVGIRYGKDKIFRHKSLQGTLTALFVCAVICFIYLYTHNILVDHIFGVSLAAGIIGALSELIPVGKLDDNLTLPVLSASALWLMFYLLGAL